MLSRIQISNLIKNKEDDRKNIIIATDTEKLVKKYLKKNKIKRV